MLIAWRLVIVMDVLYVSKSCPAFPVKRPRNKSTSGEFLFNFPLAVDPRCLLEIFIPLPLTKIVKKQIKMDDSQYLELQPTLKIVLLGTKTFHSDRKLSPDAYVWESS